MDSKSAIQTIASKKQATTQIVQETRRTIKLLNKQDKTTVFQWIPSHVGIHGNETADLLAKKGTTLLSKRTTLNCETIEAYKAIKLKKNSSERPLHYPEKQWQNIKSTWENNKNKPRKQAVALFRQTQVTTVSQHTFIALKFSVITTAQYEKQKNTIMDKFHLLLCPKPDQTSKELSKLYWDARRLME